MTTTYTFNIVNTTNINNKIIQLEDRINVNFTILTSLVSVSYNGVNQNVLIEFSSALSIPEQKVLNILVQIIVEERNTNEYYPSTRTIDSIRFPNIKSDILNGYNIGDMLVNTTNNELYTCQDNTIDNAIWFLNINANSTQTLTNKTITDPSNDVVANGLHSTTTSVNVSNSLAPIAGQLLIATSGTSASWSALPQGRAIKDEQIVTATSSITKDSTTFSDIDGMTLTTSSSANLDYTIIFNVEMKTSPSSTLVEMDITIDGVPIITKSSGSISKSLLVMIIGYAANVPSGSVVNVRSRIIGASGTSNFDRRTLFISGL